MSSFPLRERWQPVRGGLINLFKYEDQVFRYENGHLLLRGDNGSGKSRVLALQLPFLLDGDLSPYRVEPDRDPAKRMEWHLLMDRHERRTGYTWIEFGRVDSDGSEHFLTLGCGMEARKGAGAPNRWFFITPQRIGEDWSPVRNRVPLGRRQLSAEFEEAGQGEIFSSKGTYRAAVDKALFKLGSRYDPLIDLLIQLRQPQLMRDMKEGALSKALSEALPPVEESLIAEVAESFQGLDTDRQRTDDHREMLESVEIFADGYRQYLAVAVRRLCGVVRRGHSQFEHATRDLRDVEEQIAINARQLTEARTRRQEIATRLAAARAESATLRESPEMRDKHELDRAQSHAETCGREAAATLKDLRSAERHRESARSEEERRETHFDELRERLRKRHRDLGREHEGVATREEAFFEWDREDADLQASQAETGRFIDAHHRGIGHLRKQNAAVAREQQDADRAREDFERAREQLEEAEELERAAEIAFTNAIEEFGAAAAGWERTLAELTPEIFPRGEDWAEALAEWIPETEGTFVFHQRLSEACRRVIEEIAAERAALDTASKTLDSERDEVADEHLRLREGRQPAPPAPHTRASRPDDRPGAPFWKRFEFRDEIPESERAGWEAALESAGLLDAWIFPDGTWEIEGEPDAFLGMGTDPELDPQNSLAAVLQPTDDDGSLTHLLRRIGNHRDAARCWVSRDGFWANGPHHGRWTKENSEFLGHQAREAARRRRIAELEMRLRELDERLESLRNQREQIRERETALNVEAEAAPSIRPAETAAIERAAHRESIQKRKLQSIESEKRFHEARTRLNAAIEKRDADAADLGLVDWAEPESLDTFAKNLDAFEKSAIAFWPAWQRVLEASDELNQARQRKADADAATEQQTVRHGEKRDLAEGARVRAETLLATVGAGVEEIMSRIRRAESAVDSAEGEISEVEQSIREAEKEEARYEERQRAAAERRGSAEEDRNRAVDRMGVFVAERLFEELDPESQPDRETFSATAAVELARRFERELKQHREDDDHWNQLQSEIGQSFNQLSDQLVRHGNAPDMRMVDENSVCVVRCEFQGQPRSVREFHEVLSGELASRRRIFEEREREIIENHLIGEAAVAVQKRIRDGEEWVVNVNKELARVPTSSGIQLKFDWQIADRDDEQLKAVRALFLKQSATWTLGERDAIGSFLQNRIQSSRESDDSRTWRDHLRHALDYRAWHRFGILRRQSSGDGWKRLTKRTFGTGSGGEKALTLTVPQFAAAAAHYHSAHRHAPRLILLDEVFVGIDADTRARLMGLLETFDLDYVMTSEREWGAFPTVSALAIYQLATRPGLNAVAATRWVWNGKEKHRDDGAAEENSRTPVATEAGASDA